MAEHKLIQVEKISVNPYQPRKEFDETGLLELAQSIRENGLIQPIVVREVGNEAYEIIAGERRYRAMLMIGKVEVPCIVTTATDEASASIALIENIQREDLNPIEEANAYRQILKTQGMTQKKLAQQIGKSQSFVANKIRLLELPERALSTLAQGKITERHARALLTVDDEELDQVLDKILDQKLNVSQTERLIQKPKKPKKPLIKGISQSIKIGINTIKEAVLMVEKTGIKVNQEIEETEDEVVITVRFPK